MNEDLIVRNENGCMIGVKCDGKFQRKSKGTVLIFGVTGQDGSYLAELLINDGYKVIGVTRRVSVDNTGRLKDLIKNVNPETFSLASGDVTDQANVIKLVQEYKPCHIYNLAAQSHVKVSFEQPALTWDITARGALNILEAIRLTDTSIRYYQASTSEMFGDKYSSEAGQQMYQDENTVFNPRSPYSVAKLAAHNFTVLYRDSYKIHASSGILFNHESPRRGEYFVTRKITKYVGEFYRQYQHLIECGMLEHEALDTMSYEKKLELGNLDAYRDWGHARDYVRAMKMMIEADKADDYVIATGEAHSVREFLDFSFGAIGIKDWSRFVVVNPAFFRPAEVPYLRGIAVKAKNKLGWKPEISFKELAEEMVKHDILNV
jgi:GDPmannose 4,6-dehydratase